MPNNKKYTNIFVLFAWMTNALVFANLIVFYIKPVWAYIVNAADRYTSLFDIVIMAAGTEDTVSKQIFKLHIFAVVWAIVYWGAIYYIRIKSMLWGEIKAVNYLWIIKHIVWGYMIPLMASYIVLMVINIILISMYGGYRWIEMALYMIAYLMFVGGFGLLEVMRARRIIRIRRSYTEE